MKHRNGLLQFCARLLWQVLLIPVFQLAHAAPGNTDSLVKEAMKQGDIPGLVLVIVQDGKVSIQPYGYSNVAKGEKVGPSTMFELASCTKAFTALAVLKLAEQGKLDLEAPVSKYLPDFKVYFDKKETPIYLKQLLHHTSGIPWHSISEIPIGSGPNSIAAAVKTVNGSTLKTLPGAEFHYATINYDILGLIIEKVSGISYERYLRESVLLPLGLSGTYPGRENVPDSLAIASGYKISFFKARPYDAPSFGGNNPAGYMMSDGQDIARWLQLQLGLIDNEFSKVITLSQQSDETVAPLANTSYCMGWKKSLWGDNAVFHEGLNPNYSSYVGLLPGKRTGVAILSNSNSAYTQFLGETILLSLENMELPDRLRPEDGIDTSFSVASFILIFYLVLVAAYLVYALTGIAKRKRVYRKAGRKSIKGMALMLLGILPALAGIYLLPQAYMHFSWSSIQVWGPDSFKVMIALLLGAIAFSYAVYILSVLFPDKNKFTGLLAQTAVISVLSGLANMVLILLITSSIGAKDNLRYVLFYFGLMVIIYIFGRSTVQRRLINFTRNLVHDIRMTLIKKILSSSYQKFEKIEKGRILATVNGDIHVIGNIAYMVITLLTSVITVAGAFFYLASIAFWATVLTIVLVVLISLLYYYFSVKTRPLFEEARDTSNTLMSYMTDLMSGYKEISLSRRKKQEFHHDIELLSDNLRTKVTRAETSFVYAFLIGESLLILVLGISAFALPVIFPGIKLSVFTSFIIILLYLIGPVNGILGAIPQILQFRVAWKRVKTFTDEIPTDLPMDDPIGITVSSTVHSFTAKGLAFHYDNKEDTSRFGVGPVDFTLHQGEIMFITGGNGSGKTTLAKLITGLYKPGEGYLAVDGKRVEAGLLGEYFSGIFSPAHLFKKIYAVDGEDREAEIAQYLEQLELSHKVNIRNMQFNTLDLSNGQLKRLALLQCYLEDKPIYLFDEWAADQDPEYRKFFYKELLPKMKAKNKIIIAITHDDHYFGVADKILKLNMGQVEFMQDKDALLAPELPGFSIHQ